MVKLTKELLKIPFLAAVVSTSEYQCIVEDTGLEIEYKWSNTNTLLQKKGWKGVKTGTTPMAGCCLSSYYQNIDSETYEKLEAVIVILGCDNDANRFKETEFLLNEFIKFKLEYS